MVAAEQLAAVPVAQRALFESILSTMLDIPAGRFQMGDVSGKGGADERPVRTVSLRAFRLGKYEVTFDQYDVFATSTGRVLPGDDAWGRTQRPVINVSWEDAHAFIAWLNRQSGLKFRLPSEAEWEYAARAGSITEYPWGDAFDPNRANGDGTSRQDQWAYTAPVGSFPANAFGLFDMHGNAWEWTQDCGGNYGYEGAPTDGSAWLAGDCSHRVLRGGGWFQIASWLRSPGRYWVSAAFRNNGLGFRLALD